MAWFFGWQYIEEVIVIVKYVFNLFVHQSVGTPGFGVLDIVLFFIRSIVLVFYPLFLYLYMQVVLTRYAVNRNFMVFFQFWKNFKILSMNLDSALLIIFFSILGAEVLSLTSTFAGLTVIGITLVVIFYFPMLSWMDAYFSSELGMECKKDPDPQMSAKPFLSALYFTAASSVAVFVPGILLDFFQG